MLPEEVREDDNLVETNLNVKQRDRGLKRHSNRTGGPAALVNDRS